MLVLPLVDQELEQVILLNFIIFNLTNYNLVYEIEIILSYTSLKYSRSFFSKKDGTQTRTKEDGSDSELRSCDNQVNLNFIEL